MPRDHLGQFNMSSGLEFARGVLLLDDCEGTFGWVVGGTGADFTGEYAAAAAFMGTKGLHLATRTTAPAGDDTVTAAKLLSYPVSGLAVVRLRVASPTWADVKTFGFFLRAYNGVHAWYAALFLTPATPAVSYYNSGGGITAIPTMAFATGDGAFVTMELVVDLLAMQYVSAMCYGVSVDLAGAGMLDMGADTDRMTALDLNVVAAGAATAQVYVDSIYAGEFLYV